MGKARDDSAERLIVVNRVRGESPCDRPRAPQFGPPGDDQLIARMDVNVKPTGQFIGLLDIGRRLPHPNGIVPALIDPAGDRGKHLLAFIARQTAVHDLLDAVDVCKVRIPVLKIYVYHFPSN